MLFVRRGNKNAIILRLLLNKPNQNRKKWLQFPEWHCLSWLFYVFCISVVDVNFSVFCLSYAGKEKLYHEYESGEGTCRTAGA